jgi:DNA-directed RNA polymerase subunit L
MPAIETYHDSLEIWNYGTFRICLTKTPGTQLWKYEIQHPSVSVCPLTRELPKEVALTRAILAIEKELRFMRRQAEDVIARVEEDFSKLALAEFPEQVTSEVFRVRPIHLEKELNGED